jgi:colanic acid biosynthesis glycosyl transferase WcaI
VASETSSTGLRSPSWPRGEIYPLPSLSGGRQRAIRALFHDYGGHALTVNLARAVCTQGFDVSYVSFASFPTPKGKTAAEADDPENFRIAAISIDEPFDKDNLVQRLRHERAYAARLRTHVLAERPDVVISSNAPLGVQQTLLDACGRLGAGFVFWCQDIHSAAIERLLGKRHAAIGSLAGRYFRRKERALLERSDGVILVTDAFRQVLGGDGWGLDTSGMAVIENIAAVEDGPGLPRDNPWSLANMRPGRQRIVYTGTLARKHNPELILDLARGVDADVWLFSEGSSAEYVAATGTAEGLSNLFVRPWLSIGDLPSALAAADVLLAVLDAEAGVFSVPSKVLSYLSAGRPVLGSIPAQNLAAETIVRAAGGLVSAPGDSAALLADAARLLGDADLRQRMGANGRRYAEHNFDLGEVSRRFAEILNAAAAAAARRRSLH